MVHDNEEELYEYFISMLQTAMRIRDQINNYQGNKLFKKLWIILMNISTRSPCP